MPNTYHLAGKSAVVTGGAQGIGRAIVERFVASGASALVWEANLVEIPGARCSIVDVTDPDQIAARRAHASRDSRIDIRVNDAGYLGRNQPFDGHAPDDWRRILDVNLIGTMQVTRAVLAYLLRRGRGRIVNLGSLAGKEGLANLAAYSAASAGVISCTEAFSREVVGQNIFVNCVAPGPIDTDMIRDLGAAVVERMIADSPMKRFGSPNEAAHRVAPDCVRRRAASTRARCSTCPVGAPGTEVQERRRAGDRAMAQRSRPAATGRHSTRPTNHRRAARRRTLRPSERAARRRPQSRGRSRR
jgi:2-dehydro-3-deoxy-L-rhamnonate dehydrogenase (NAD+)